MDMRLEVFSAVRVNIVFLLSVTTCKSYRWFPTFRRNILPPSSGYKWHYPEVHSFTSVYHGPACLYGLVRQLMRQHDVITAYRRIGEAVPLKASLNVVHSVVTDEALAIESWR
jgi:hypothetical protein